MTPNVALRRLEARGGWDEADLNDFAIVERTLGQLEAIRRAVDQNERGPEYGWTHPDEEAHDLRRKLRLILGDPNPASEPESS